MPVSGIMFRPKYRGGAKYARLFQCMGCNKQISKTPAKDRLIYEIPNEGETEKGFIMFYKCECGTVNWTHALRSNIDLYDEVTKIATIPDWAEGDPVLGEIDYTMRSVDSRTMLPYGETEASLEKIKRALQTLMADSEWKPLILSHKLKSKDEKYGLIDRYLDEHWFMIDDNGQVRGTWTEWRADSR